MSKMDEVFDLVVRGKSKLIAAAVQEALDEGNAAPDVLDNMIKAMGVVGEKFKNNEIFVPEMLVAARAMKKAKNLENLFRGFRCLKEWLQPGYRA